MIGRWLGGIRDWRVYKERSSVKTYLRDLLAGIDATEHCENECGCFARSRLRLADHVFGSVHKATEYDHITV